jgi:hypothetical protein
MYRPGKWTQVLLGSIGLALVLVLASSIARPAKGLPGEGTSAHYYTDSAFTNHVGMQMILRCNGSTGPVVGNVAEHVLEYSYDCHEGTYHPSRCMRYYWSCPVGGTPNQCQQYAPATTENCPPWFGI